MRNYNELVEINHNPNWPYIPDHPYRTLIIGGSGSGKANVLLNLIKHQQPDVDKNDFCFKNLFESKYQLLINVGKKVEMRKIKNSWTLFDCSQTIDDVHENVEDYNSTKKRKVLIVFDDMIADMEANGFSSEVKNLKFHFLLYQNLFTIILHYFIMEILIKKRDLQQIASNHSSDIKFKDLIKLYKDYSERYNFTIR